MERKRTADKALIEDEALRLKDSVAEITEDNLDLRKKL